MSTQKTTGYIIALIGSIVALLAFFVMPYVSLGFVGSETGVQIFTTVIQALRATSSTFPAFNPANNQASYLLLIVLLPIGAAITTLIAGVQLSRGARAGKAGAASLIVLSGLMLVGLIGVYIYLASNTPAGSPVSITSLLAIGYWVNMFAMIAVIIGGILALRTASPAVSQSWPQPPVWSSSQEHRQPMQRPQQAQPWQQSQQQWPPSQGSQSSPQWPPSQQQPPWQ